MAEKDKLHHIHDVEAYTESLRTSWDHWHRNSGVLQDLSAHHLDALTRTHSENLRKALTKLRELGPRFASANVFAAYQEYVQDVAQRTALFVDTLCKRGDAYLLREQEGFPTVLAFDHEMVVDGRQLERPVNYALVRIHPPEGFPPQREDGRPWVIVDPRAGHGSGIGGFKSESEVGVALMDGHPVYFVIFFPYPVPGQTLADICKAEAVFLRQVRERHPRSPKPLVTGNCQGGWASMILAATHPDLMGPIVIAGTPLSYWAGKRGRNPFRYLGGIAGGAVPALLVSDLGGGIFDGATLVTNFESLNPGKTWFRKNYDLFSEVDEAAERYLDFERWWSGFYFFNDNEIRWIIEQLFIGNKLSRGKAVLNDGTPIDLTRIASPVIVFASHGDNITPPQQALNWISDLYETDQELKARGHVIIYTLHDSIGHLGIFVSAEVAGKQHKQITSVVKTIEALAPGLYEMLIEQDRDRFTVSFEARSMEDILALGDGREDDAHFAAVARFSEWATKTYELTWQPLLRAIVTPQLAEANRKLHPGRLQNYVFSKSNPLMGEIEGYAERTRANRTPAAIDNPFLQLERLYADIIEQSWNLYRDARDAWTELLFHGIYGTPWMKQLTALDDAYADARDISRLPQVQSAIAKAEAGGYPEAIVRMLVILARARGSVRRERLERANKILMSRPPFDTMPIEHRSQLIREQSMIAEFAGDEAISTLPKLLKDDVDRLRAVNLVYDIAGPVDDMDGPTVAMFKRLQATLRTIARDWRNPEPRTATSETSPRMDGADGKEGRGTVHQDGTGAGAPNESNRVLRADSQHKH